MKAWQNYQAQTSQFEGRVILVTGAAQGIGERAAMALAKLGAIPVLLDQNERKLSQVYDLIENQTGVSPVEVPLDLAHLGEEGISQLAQKIEQEFGRLDGILHAANGFSQLSPLSDQTLDEWIEMFRVNVAAPFAITRALFPLLAQAPDAAVLVLGEMHALSPRAFWGGYSVSKAGQANWVSIAADEWEQFSQVRINLLVPGPIHSPFRLATHPAEDKTPLPLIEDLLPTLLFWLGPASRGQSGQLIRFTADNHPA